MAFFFKVFPEIILDGRLFIAEPPLYRVDDPKNPFVINKEDYINRYVKAVSKDYKIGLIYTSENNKEVYMSKDELTRFLTETSSYVDDMDLISKHYKTNGRLIEIIFEEIASIRGFRNSATTISEEIRILDIQHLMDNISAEFPEIYYDERDNLIKGVADGKHQLIEISESLIRKGASIISILIKYGITGDVSIVLKNIKTASENKMSTLGVLKIVKKYQPNILHRFKGLGENDSDDIKTTIMDPNTRTLIKVNIEDIENDMKIFQVLRGGSPLDAQARKDMMRAYKIPRDMIDT